MHHHLLKKYAKESPLTFTSPQWAEGWKRGRMTSREEETHE